MNTLNIQSHFYRRLAFWIKKGHELLRLTRNQGYTCKANIKSTKSVVTKKLAVLLSILNSRMRLVSKLVLYITQLQGMLTHKWELSPFLDSIT